MVVSLDQSKTVKSTTVAAVKTGISDKTYSNKFLRFHPKLMKLDHRCYSITIVACSAPCGSFQEPICVSGIVQSETREARVKFTVRVLNQVDQSIIVPKKCEVTMVRPH